MLNPTLNRNVFFVKEFVGLFKAANEFDILDPDTQKPLLTCREPNLGFFTKMFRFTEYKRLTPFELVVSAADGTTVLTVRRGVTFLRSVVEVLDSNGAIVGRFRQRLLSFGGKFDVQDADGNFLCTLKGEWTSWNFSFSKDGVEFAHVSKQWAGLAKELFTTADNYVLEIRPSVPENHPMRLLILGAVLCIDMVLKE